MRCARIVTVGLLLSLLASGCASFGITGKPVASDERAEKPAEDPVAEPGLEPAARWSRALSLLEVGDAARAEAELVELRETAPAYRERAGRLLEQLRTPVNQLLPREHFNVRLRAGQSLSLLSGRYLGDVLQFYALARYNAIPEPRRVETGQLIRIPMTEEARSVRRAETGAADTDDPIDDGIPQAEPGTDAIQEGESATAAGTGDDAAPDPETRAEIRDYYRRATVAFQRQDLDQTLRYCGRVLELDPEHANCLAYRERARELQLRLERLESEDTAAP